LFVNQPGQDDNLINEAVFIPKISLQAFTTYTMNVKLLLNMVDGTMQPMDKIWTFSTERQKDYWKSVMHSGVRHTASFGLDDSFFYVDGVKIRMMMKPEIVEGSAYLYVRDLTKALGANVAWDSEQLAAVYEKGERKVVLYTTKNAVEVDGEMKQTDTPAKLINSTTMIPVRLLAEVLGSAVSYNPETRTVTISYE
jgi:hypothetical protein